MSKVDKMIIGCHAIMADGGFIATSGVGIAIQAANMFSVPVIVIAPWYKLTPLHPFDYTTFNELYSPDQIFKPRKDEDPNTIDVISPGFDYIEPDDVSLYVTNNGCHTPNYIYSLFS
jgi:translation initiation factor eIF-2B subunit beta